MTRAAHSNRSFAETGYRKAMSRNDPWMGESAHAQREADEIARGSRKLHEALCRQHRRILRHLQANGNTVVWL